MAAGWGSGLLALAMAMTLVMITKADNPWNYADQSAWADDCAGDEATRQSPINVESSEAVYQEELPAISLLFVEHHEREENEMEVLAQVMAEEATTQAEVVEEMIVPEEAAELEGMEPTTTPEEVVEEMIVPEEVAELGGMEPTTTPEEVVEEMIVPEEVAVVGAAEPTNPPEEVVEEIIVPEEAAELEGMEPTTTPEEIVEEMIVPEEAVELEGMEPTTTPEEVVEDMFVVQDAGHLESEGEQEELESAGTTTTPVDSVEDAIVPEMAGELGPPAEEDEDDVESLLESLLIPDETTVDEETDAVGEEEPAPGETEDNLDEEEVVEETIVAEHADTVESEPTPTPEEEEGEEEDEGEEEEEEEEEEEDEDEDEDEEEAAGEASESSEGGEPTLLLTGAQAQARSEEAMLLQNNGHSLLVTLNQDIFIVGGGLGDMYKADHIHFHWGSVDEQGSEHSIDGEHYPLEMHMVSYDSDHYATLGEAIDGDNSLAVLGVFFQVTNKDNPALAPIISVIDNVLDAGTSHPLEEDLDISALLPQRTQEFFRYDGSLTTPPCHQSVVWTLFKDTLTISKDQLMKMRKLRSSAAGTEPVAMYDNYRETQKLNGREVYASFVPSAYIQPQVLNVKSDPDNGCSAVSSNAFTYVSLITAAMIVNRFYY